MPHIMLRQSCPLIVLDQACRLSSVMLLSYSSSFVSGEVDSSRLHSLWLVCGSESISVPSHSCASLRVITVSAEGSRALDRPSSSSVYVTSVSEACQQITLRQRTSSLLWALTTSYSSPVLASNASYSRQSSARPCISDRKFALKLSDAL